MKAGKIILKNIKLLLRSRISTLVIILGPLLVIVLVGISFSTSTFNLNIGVSTTKYSELSNSLVEQLKKDNFAIAKFQVEDLCIQSVKDGLIHACLVLPPDLDIENEGTNTIRIHVDQSKINLVFLVENSLRKSVGQTTTEISRDLTDKIVTTLFNSKNNLQDKEPVIAEIISDNSALLAESDASLSSLDNLDLSSGTSINVESELSRLKSGLDDVFEETISLVDVTLELAENDFMDYVDDVGNNRSGAYENDVEDLITNLQDLNSTLKNSHNSTIKDLDNFVDDFNDIVEEFGDKLKSAESTTSEVINKLKTIKDKGSNIKDKSENLQTDLKRIIGDINAIEITNIENIISPINTEINEVVQSQSNLGFLFPSLIVMLIMFIGLLLPSTLIIMEKKSKAYFRVFTTPTRSWLFILATYLTSFILVLVQLIIIIIVSQYYFKLNFMNSFLILITTLFFIMSFFILLGMFIGYVFNTEELAMLASVSIGTLLLLTSGIIFPLESMPAYVVEKAKFNPVVLGSEMFKKSLLFGTNFSSVKQPLAYLLLFSVIILVLILVVKKAEKLHHRFRKPSRKKIRKDYLINLFDFGNRKAKTLPEFLVSVQNLNEEKFRTLLNENVFVEWLMLVYRNKFLAKLITNIKTKEELISTLTQELKKFSPKK